MPAHVGTGLQAATTLEFAAPINTLPHSILHGYAKMGTKAGGELGLSVVQVSFAPTAPPKQR